MSKAHYLGKCPRTDRDVYVWEDNEPNQSKWFIIYQYGGKILVFEKKWEHRLDWRTFHENHIATLEKAKNIWRKYLQKYQVQWQKEGF